MTRCRWVPGLCILLLVTACALPQHKDVSDDSKEAVTWAEASNVISQLNRQARAASATYSLPALRDVERGSLFDIDAARLVAARRLGGAAGAGVGAGKDIAVTRLGGNVTLLAGSFRRYPLWFVAVTDTYGGTGRTAGVFVKSSSTDVWRLAAAPRLSAGTRLPALATSSDGSPVVVPPALRIPGLATPQRLVDRYTRVLAHPGGTAAAGFGSDPLVSAIRESLQPHVSGKVTVSRTWSAAPVRYVLRLSDGGALVFATVLRTDTYRPSSGSVLSWQRSPAAAYLQHPVHRRAVLTYAHQVLLWQPFEGDAHLIGDYGGLVAAAGH
jgi:hypothetical protein